MSPRVVVAALNVPGPVAAAKLRDAGATVTKIEPVAGDPLERYAPPWYRELTAGMNILRLNARLDADRARFHAEIERADLLITSMRPRALRHIGLDDETFSDRFPRLWWIRIVGKTGADADLPGHDLTYLAEAGLLVPPHVPPSLFSDLMASERTVSVAFEALLAQKSGAASGIVDVAIADLAHELARPLREGLTAPNGILGGGNAAYQIYRSSDGWIAVAALEEHFREELRIQLALPALTSDAVQRAFEWQSSRYWEAWGKERDLPIVAVPARA